MTKEPWTLLKLLQWTTDYFREKKIDAPRLTAEVLLAHVLGCKRISLYTGYDNVPNDSQLARFRELVRERVKGVPAKYLTGHCEFMSMDFDVNPSVMIPRSETETLVEKALELLSAGDVPAPQIIDLATGCGNIAIVLASRLPGAELVATDVSAEALATARGNARRHGVEGRIRFLQGDLYEALSALPSPPQADMITANPPYVSDAEWASLPREIREHEPERALRAGQTGLEAIQRVVAGAPAFLKSGGHMLVEIGEGQAKAAVQSAAEAKEFTSCELVRDYGGTERILAARKGTS